MQTNSGDPLGTQVHMLQSHADTAAAINRAEGCMGSSSLSIRTYDVAKGEDTSTEEKRDFPFLTESLISRSK